MSQDDLIKLAKKINYDLTAVKTNVTELTRLIAALNVPDTTRVKCRHCGLSLAGEKALAEHLYISHDGPEPEHWLEAESKADIHG